MTIEREVKFIADANTELPDLRTVDPRLTIGAPHRKQLSAIYYDTPSLSLARSGVTLRARTGEPGPVWTLKLPRPDKAVGLSRLEETFAEPLGPIPAQARLAVRAYVRSQALGPVVRLHTDRTERSVALDGAPLLELVDDWVVADGGTEPVTKFREIEVELVTDDVDEDVVVRVVHALRRAGCRDDEPTPKAIRALGSRALAPPDVPKVRVGKHSTARALVRASISNSVAQLIDHHGGVWLGGDIEDVHQFRVATRRLRSDLRTFAPLLDSRWVTWLRDELRWLGGEVGVARDSDVLTARLKSQLDQLPRDDAVAVQRLLQRLADNSTDARRHVVVALSGDRYVTLLDALVDAALEPRFASAGATVADQPGRDVFVKIVRKPWRKLAAAAEALTPESPDSAFHAVRIRAKKSRYALEAVIPLYGGDARRLAKAVERVQSVLGDHQDTAVAETWLRQAAKELPSTRLVVGQLITIERLERLRLRAAFKSVWKRASQRELVDWLE